MSPDIESFASRSALMPALADRVTEDLQAALAHKARTSLAVPGGTTPGPFLGNLSGRDLHWNKVDVTLTDERWVPLNHPHSNDRLVRASLLSQRAAAVNFLPLYSEAYEPEQALARVAVALEILWPLYVCVLGMGTDSHTASLFPSSDKLDEALDPECTASVLPMRTPDTPEPRITLTAPVLTAASHTYSINCRRRQGGGAAACAGSGPRYGDAGPCGPARAGSRHRLSGAASSAARRKL